MNIISLGENMLNKLNKFNKNISKNIIVMFFIFLFPSQFITTFANTQNTTNEPFVDEPIVIEEIEQSEETNMILPYVHTVQEIYVQTETINVARMAEISTSDNSKPENILLMANAIKKSSTPSSIMFQITITAVVIALMFISFLIWQIRKNTKKNNQ